MNEIRTFSKSHNIQILSHLVRQYCQHYGWIFLSVVEDSLGAAITY